MIEVLLYGNVREIVKEKMPNSNTILLFDYIEGEHFQDLLHRLGLKLEDVGDCYINGALADPDNEIRDLDTVELNQRKHQTAHETN
ncbi:MAG: hypothetical protein EAX95_16050 [Candidatus Thorarchaeota archaeon]|nr:hypothetical protein [Candidatus Thorarchaeota archaeon]